MSNPDVLRLLTAQRIGTSAATGEIQDALYGPLKKMNKPPREKVVYDLSNPEGSTPNLRSLAQGGPSRRTQRLHGNQGGRSPQGNGHGHKRTFLGRR